MIDLKNIDKLKFQAAPDGLRACHFFAALKVTARKT